MVRLTSECRREEIKRLGLMIKSEKEREALIETVDANDEALEPLRAMPLHRAEQPVEFGKMLDRWEGQNGG